MWRPHVYSKLTAVPSGRLDDFHTLTEEEPSDYEFTKKIIKRSGLAKERSVAFIQDCGDRFYVGVDGHVSQILGEAHPCAYEQEVLRNGPVKGRSITFVHGYFAPKNTTIPGIDSLLSQQKKDLDDILSRANQEGAVQGKPVKASHTTFSGERVPGTDWDQFASEFQAGMHKGKTATFTKDGKLFRLLEPESESLAAKIVETGSAQKKTIPLRTTPCEIAFLPLAAISLGVLAAGWVMMEIFRSLSSSNRSEQKGR
jgi:hypothetical protein